MKILYINALYYPDVKGGAEISLKLLVEGMQKAGFEVVVLALSTQEGLHVDTVDGVRVYRAGLKNLYWPFLSTKANSITRLFWHINDRNNKAMQLFVDDVISREKPDVVSCHNLVGWSVGTYDLLTARKIPFIQVLHDFYLLCPNSNMYKNGTDCNKQCLSCKLLRTGFLVKSNKANTVVGISQAIIDRFKQFGYFKSSRESVIYNARTIADTGRKAARSKNDVFTIGYIGTLAPIKGVEWLIDQFKKLDGQVQLKIAGSGQAVYVAQLESSIKDHPIALLGQMQPKDFYPQIDLLVVPSLWNEPLGMVAIEGLAYHVPVIASAKGGLKETIQDGVNGLLCYPQEPDSLYAAMNKLYTNVAFYNQLKDNARKSVEQQLSVERMVSEYKDTMMTIKND